MKKLLLILSILFSLTLFSQVKRLEVTHKETGKQLFFEGGQRVKLTTSDRKKLVGTFAVTDMQTININGIDVKVDNISSIKYYPRGGRTAKNILLGTGAGLVASSGVAAAFSNGSAFSLFAGGTASIIAGALVNNKNKALIHRHYMYKIVE